MSFPNQKTIIIHQSDQIPFLKIGIEELMDAFKTIKTPSTFILYLYLASNKDGYELELSKEAFANATGLSKSSYHRAVEHLTKLGYIYEDNCGRLNFATKPKEGPRTAIRNWEENSSKSEHPKIKNETAKSQICNASLSEMNTEINNKDNKEKQIIINGASRSSLDYLKEIIAPTSEYIGGGKKGEWLEDEVPNLWFFVRAKDNRLAREIQQYTDFSLKEAKYIADSILNWNRRMLKIREGDF